MSNLRADIKRYYEKTYGGVRPPDLRLDKFIAHILGPDVEHQERWINERVPLKKNARILDYGSGVGGFVLRMREKGRFVDGVEIEPALIDIARHWAKERGIAEAGFMLSQNGKIPAADNSYDLVFSYFVLEHVADLFRYFSEALRVLKPGGKFLITTCYYSLGWEYHYCVWLPLFSKRLSKLILRAKGRDVVFFDDLCFVTPRKIRNCLHELTLSGYRFKVQNVGREYFQKGLNDPEMHSRLFISLAKVAKIFGLLPILEKFDLYNPLVYILTKS
jgi:SAM-dependent methyltransferase